MKSTFKAKYLQHLVKKNQNKGFTLIELLVVIIIVGVLAAIALPSFLNQIGKARGSEAKSSLGTINRSQQAYRYEQNTFATVISNLDADVNGKFYSYAVSGTPTSSFAAATASTTQTELKGYSAAAQQESNNFTQVVCETADVVASGSAATAPSAAAGGTPTCGGTDKTIQ